MFRHSPYRHPRRKPTARWLEETTIVIVSVARGRPQRPGLWLRRYCHRTINRFNAEKIVLNKNAAFVPGHLERNGPTRFATSGGRVISSMAIAAVDNALWDLYAQILQTPLVTLLGQVRETIPVYGSGGFTSYSDAELRCQFAGLGGGRHWRREDEGWGSQPEADPVRVKTARESIGASVKLFVDANGAYSRKQALEKAEQFRDLDVSWFEEPVSSDDLEGLRLLRDRGPAAWTLPRANMATTLLFPPHAGSRSGGRAASRCHAVRGRHRISSGRCSLPELRIASLGAHRTLRACASVLRGVVGAKRGIFLRPRAHRTDVL